MRPFFQLRWLHCADGYDEIARRSTRPVIWFQWINQSRQHTCLSTGSQPRTFDTVLSLASLSSIVMALSVSSSLTAELASAMDRYLFRQLKNQNRNHRLGQLFDLYCHQSISTKLHCTAADIGWVDDRRTDMPSQLGSHRPQGLVYRFSRLLDRFLHQNRRYKFKLPHERILHLNR